MRKVKWGLAQKRNARVKRVKVQDCVIKTARGQGQDSRVKVIVVGRAKKAQAKNAKWSIRGERVIDFVEESKPRAGFAVISNKFRNTISIGTSFGERSFQGKPIKDTE